MVICGHFFNIKFNFVRLLEFAACLLKIFVEKFDKSSILLERITHQKGKGGRQ